MRLVELVSGALIAFGLAVLAFHLAPASWWYEYKSIVPIKPVFVVGEPLKLVSTLRVQQAGAGIVFKDQLRCITDAGDEVVAASTFPTALREPEGPWRKTPWTWGNIPESVPRDVPCYIRSVQTLSVLFGIQKTTEVDSETFTISDFDYTKQQSG